MNVLIEKVSLYFETKFFKKTKYVKFVSSIGAILLNNEKLCFAKIGPMVWQ